ncbi:uncharacterized protein LOC134797902 [Cydia splendana]|uniref:uncharacterized protein LOC134797902 n=1 Tax=Cydia splendana TaxID=1100963 RepID=UPI0028F4C948
MKAVAILFLAAIAMASAQGVNVVGNNPGPGQVNVVEQPGYTVKTVGQPNQGVDSGFYRPSGGDNVVITNPDPGFYLGGANTGAGAQDVDPAFGRPTVYGNLRPLKYPNPAARTGQ